MTYDEIRVGDAFEFNGLRREILSIDPDGVDVLRWLHDGTTLRGRESRSAVTNLLRGLGPDSWIPLTDPRMRMPDGI